MKQKKGRVTKLEIVIEVESKEMRGGATPLQIYLVPIIVALDVNAML